MSPSKQRVTRATSTFDPVPSRIRSAQLTIDVAAAPPPGTEALGVPVATSGDVPSVVGVDRARLLESGFTGALGQTLVLPHEDRPVIVAIGIGDEAELDASALRDAAAAFARAAARDGILATTLTDLAGVDAAAAGQAVVEGVLLARYRYRAFVDRPAEAPLTSLTLVATGGRARGVRAGAERGRVLAEAVQVARDLANTPATASHRDADGRGRQGPRDGGRAQGRGVRQGRPRRARLRRAAGREPGQRRTGPDDQADVHARKRDGRRPGRRATSPSSARGSCTTPAASASSRPTRCTSR